LVLLRAILRFTGLTVGDWLNRQSFRDQYEFGSDVLTQIRVGTTK
jgi:hypothetical protein